MNKKLKLFIAALWLCLVFFLAGMFAGACITRQDYEDFNSSQKHFEYTYAGFEYCPKCGVKLEKQ